MTKATISVHELCLTGVFTAVTIILSQVSIPLPFTPVPLTLGLAAVYLSGLLLPARAAFFSQLCYLLLGAAGLPVFHNFQGGMGVLFGPTGGYLFAYPLAALLIALAAARFTGRAAVTCLLGTHLVATALLYLIGTLWLQFLTGNSFTQALLLAVVPFVPLDLIKIAVCVIGIHPLRKRLYKRKI